MRRIVVSICSLSIFLLVAAGCIQAEAGRPLSGDGSSRGSDSGKIRENAEEREKSDFGKKTLADSEEERSYRRDNVVVTVKKLYEETRLNWIFEVTVENQNEIKKTVEGTICLFNMYIQPRECGSEECSVNMEIQPKSIQTKKFKCKGKMDVNSWAFLIVKIHNY